MKRWIAIACLVAAVGVFGWWFKDGMLMATRTKIPVEVVETDDFGDEVKTTKWEKGFQLGLMDGAGPAAGGLIGLAGLLLFLDYRTRKRAAA